MSDNSNNNSRNWIQTICTLCCACGLAWLCFGGTVSMDCTNCDTNSSELMYSTPMEMDMPSILETSPVEPVTM